MPILHKNLHNDMTAIYYLITAGREVDAQSRIIQIPVGTSRQANRDFLFMTAWAVSHGFYFELRSASVTDFVQSVRASVRPADITVESFSLRDCVRSLKRDGSLPCPKLPSESSILQRCFLDGNYRFFRALSD